MLKRTVVKNKTTAKTQEHHEKQSSVSTAAKGTGAEQVGSQSGTMWIILPPEFKPLRRHWPTPGVKESKSIMFNCFFVRKSQEIRFLMWTRWSASDQVDFVMKRSTSRVKQSQNSNEHLSLSEINSTSSWKVSQNMWKRIDLVERTVFLVNEPKALLSRRKSLKHFQNKSLTDTWTVLLLLSKLDDADLLQKKKKSLGAKDTWFHPDVFLFRRKTSDWSLYCFHFAKFLSRNPLMNWTNPQRLSATACVTRLASRKIS